MASASIGVVRRYAVSIAEAADFKSVLILKSYRPAESQATLEPYDCSKLLCRQAGACTPLIGCQQYWTDSQRHIGG
jgi:hypothetical protein